MTPLNTTARTAERETVPPFGQITFYRSVPLREPVVVYGLGNALVIRDGADGPERRYDSGLLDRLLHHYGGRTVTVKEVHDAMRLGLLPLHPEAGGTPSAYGVRDLLLILCAMGLAYVDTASAELHFTLRARRERI